MTLYRRSAQLGKVVRSVNGYGETLCIDFFMRPGGSFGFEEYRRDVETGEGWFPIGFHSGKLFADLQEAEIAALKCVAWLESELGGSKMGYETIKVETNGRVGIITLNRPKALNALNQQLLAEVVKAASGFDEDPKIGCMVLTGSEKAFAAGADIKEMQPLSYVEAFDMDLFAGWDEFTRLRKPVIAAVAGYALGGGCELAMMCDFIIAADTAKFGQPEITLGVMPGMGGSQRLTRFVGKSKAMDMCLTGRMMEAEEAESCGLVSRMVPANDLMEVALEAATKIADLSQPSVAMTKASVNRAYESTLAEGVLFERRLFHSLFATEDQDEGMTAFIEKRGAQFRNK